MYRLHIAELNTSEIIDRLSVKYRVSKRDLWEDWQKRAQWVYDVFDLEPAQAPPSTRCNCPSITFDLPKCRVAVAPSRNLEVTNAQFGKE
jgi:hypothetical protein